MKKNSKKRSRKKSPKLFEPEIRADGFFVKTSLPVVEFPSRSKAKRVADRLCAVVREELFTPKSSGRRARAKGHGFERETAIALRVVFPDARRHLEYQDAEANGVDLAHTGAFRIQCKRGKQYAPITAIEEVEFEPLFGEIPVLVTKGDEKEAMAVIPFREFINLLRNLRGQFEIPEVSKEKGLEEKRPKGLDAG